MVWNQVPSVQEPSHRAEFVSACIYVLTACLIWIPLVFVIVGLNPFRLFNSIEALLATMMFLFGAMIASATAVGGGIVFNLMLQLIFGISGFSALTLAIIVQCAGMTSGAYGWYRPGEFAQINRPQRVAMALCACVSSALFSLLFLLAIERFLSGFLLAAMKVASALVSFCVAKLLWNEIKVRREDPPGIEQARPLTVDWRIYLWIAVGALLNVTTALGIGGTWLFPHHEILRCVRKAGHRRGRHDAGRFGSQPDRDHFLIDARIPDCAYSVPRCADDTDRWSFGGIHQ